MQIEMRKNRIIIESYNLITHTADNTFLSPLDNMMLYDK